MKWQELVHKLKKLKISDDTHAKNIRPKTTNYNVNPQHFYQWWPQQNIFQILESGVNTVPLNSPRPFRHPNGRFSQRGSPSNNPNENNVHHKEILPPSLSKICLTNKITNAFYWHRKCTFATQINKCDRNWY